MASPTPVSSTAPDTPLFGREVERAALAEALDGARRSQSAALVLRGEPGVGKSALLADARGQAKATTRSCP